MDKGIELAGRRIQKARAGMGVDERTVAQFTAARGFLLAEWLGACLMVASFTLLYLLTFASDASVAWTLGSCLAMLAAGAYVFWTNHRYYSNLGFPWAKRWDAGAIVVAGSGVIFWLLFALIEALTFMGIRVGPP